MHDKDQTFNPRSRINFTHLEDYLFDILPKLLELALFTLPLIKNNIGASTRLQYNTSKFYKFRMQSGDDTNR